MAAATGVTGAVQAGGVAKPLPTGIPRFYSQACASTFGGRGDPGTGHIGYRGDNLKGKMAFAELGMGTALGGLPYKTKLGIAYKGKYVVAEKLDIGAGGVGCGGHPRKIDLWWETAQALGFSGLDTVSYIRQVGSEAEGKKLEEETGPGGINLQKGVENAITNPLEWAKDLGKVITFLSSSSSWLRIGKVLIGAALLLIAISQLTKISPDLPTVDAVGVAKKVVK